MATSISEQRHDGSRRGAVYTELEVKCLAIMCQNVNSLEEVAYYINQRFDRNAKWNAYAYKISKLKKGKGGRYHSSWQKYYDRPKGDHESLKFLKQALGFEFIFDGGHLWSPVEVDCIVKSCKEGLMDGEIRQRLELLFGRRRNARFVCFDLMVMRWSRPESPGYRIWLKHHSCHGESPSGTVRRTPISSPKALGSPDGFEEWSKGNNGISTDIMIRPRRKRPYESDECRSLFSPTLASAVPAIQEKQSLTEANPCGTAERAQTPNSKSDIQLCSPKSIPLQEDLDHYWDQLLPFLPNWLIPANASDSTTEASQSRSNSTVSEIQDGEPPNGALTPATEYCSTDVFDEESRPRSPMPRFSPEDFDRFDRFVRDFHASRASASFPH